MEEYGKILVFVMPVFLILIIIEKIFSYYKGEDTAPTMNSISSVNSGMDMQIKRVDSVKRHFYKYLFDY